MELQLHWSLSGILTQPPSVHHSGAAEFKVTIANDEATEAWFIGHIERLVTLDLLALLLLSLARPEKEQCALVLAHAESLGIEPPASALLYEAAAWDFLEKPSPKANAATAN